MDRHAIALVFDEIGTLMELLGRDRFRARAFKSAARAMDELRGDVAPLIRSGELRDVRGFGPATARVAEELLATGESTLHRELREQTPSGLLDLLAVPGLGATKVHALFAGLGIETLDDLETAARDGRVAELKGFGKRTQDRVLEGIGFVRGTERRRRQPAAYEAAARLIGYLDACPAASAVKLAGELRRRLETVDGVDVLVETDDAEAVLAAFLALPGLAQPQRDGAAAARGCLADGLELRVRCAPPGSFGAAWILATGSAAHVDALQARAAGLGAELELDGVRRKGRRRKAATEADVYRALDMSAVPPELREGRGEVEAAAHGLLPDLVDSDDLRGCFHCHTTWSDGGATVAQMAEAALERGWRYLGIADHSQAAAYAGGLTPARVRAQRREIDRWNAERADQLRLFHGIEADILADGAVDFATDAGGVLDSFDYVVASVHSGFRMDGAEMTRRVVRALKDPRVTMLGHPTGRLLLRRDGYDIDLEEVLAAAAAEGKAIEINANPNRLELDWRWWQRAKELGVRAAINPDAHSIRELDNVHVGVGAARKGWLTAADVINCWPVEEVEAFFAGANR